MWVPAEDGCLRRDGAGSRNWIKSLLQTSQFCSHAHAPAFLPILPPRTRIKPSLPTPL
jgi:hypothetical protein